MEQVIEPRIFERIKGFTVRRVLANAPSVGPFVLFDHYGPVDFTTGQGLDVGPHPHVGMATLTYLLEGTLLVRDSLGNALSLVPGGAIWMMSGRGAAHSERTPPTTRLAASRLAGAQLWLAIPRAHEEDAPWAEHFDPASLPVIEAPGSQVRVIAGSFEGRHSPAPVLSPTLCLHAELAVGGQLRLPTRDQEEHGIYVVSGQVSRGVVPVPIERMIILGPGQDALLTAQSPASVIVLGGAPLGPRHMWSTALARSPERIEQARVDWAEGRIPSVAGEAERGGFPG